MSQSRAPLAALGVFGLLILLGSGTWLAVSLQKQYKQTRQALLRAQADLDDKNKNLAMLEEEREKLSSQFDVLKGRWAKTEEELRQAKTASERAQEELLTASRERSTLAQRLNDNEQRQTTLQSEMAQLRSKIEEEASLRLALEAQAKQAATLGLTRAELEQLSERASEKDSESQELEDRMEALSHAFEQLAWKHIELQEATGQQASAGPSPLMAEPNFSPAGASASLSSEQERQARRQAEQLARRYRHLGEFCLAAYQYPRAVDAFEKSLSYKDDPQVHASLAFIYGRLLIDPGKAALHSAFAPADKINAEHALDKANTASGMPRKTRHVVWDWLVNK